MPTYWFIRHGESLAQTGEWDGPDEDVPLSEDGKQQAQALAADMAKLPVARALCSPFARAIETAHLALAESSASLSLVHGLRERFAGDWIKRIHRQVFDQDWDMQKKMGEWDHRPPGGESIKDATVRALAALKNHEEDSNTAVFSHGRVLAGVVTLLDGIDPKSGSIKPLENCVAVAREVPIGKWAELMSKITGRPTARVIKEDPPPLR